MSLNTLQKFKFHYPKALSLFFFASLFSAYLYAFATPPGSPYQPGITLDPTCAPGDTNCFVQIIPDQTANTGKFLTTDGSSTSWVALSGVSQWITTGSDIYYTTGKVGIGTITPSAKLTVVGGDALINTVTLGLGSGGVSTNTVFGYQGLGTNTTGHDNVALGYQALSTESTASFNVAIGSGALKVATNGSNTAVGYNAGTNITTGNENTAIGYTSLNGAAGNGNTAIGAFSLQANTGLGNTAIGYDALHSAGSGNNNVAIGRSSLGLATSGTNVAVGFTSLGSITTGTGNTAVGISAGYGDGTLNMRSQADDYGLFLGYQASRDSSIPQGTPLTNITAIGKNAKVATSNSIVLGGTGGDLVNVGIGTISPSERLDINGNIRFSGALMPNNTAGTNGQVLTSAGVGSVPTWTTPSTVATSVAINGLTNAVNTNTINNADYLQEWQWNTLTGSGLKLSSTSTAAASNAQKILEVSLSGANVNSSQSTYSIYGSNTHTGSGGGTKNYGVYGTATGGLTNYGIAGFATTNSNNNYGVFGSGNQGVYGSSSGFTSNPIGVAGDGGNGAGSKGLSGTSSGSYINSSNSAFANTGLLARYIGNDTGYGVYGDTSGAQIDTTAEAKTNYAGYFTAIGTRTTGGNNLTNIGLYSTATGANSNYAAIFDQGSVGVGITVPVGSFQVAPTQYSTGTASQSGTTITGVGTIWTDLMIGNEFVFADGTRRTITGRSSATILTVDTSGTVASQAYSIHYTGLVIQDTGNLLIGSTSNPGQNSRAFFYGGGTGSNIDARGFAGQFKDISQFEAEGNDYDTLPNSIAIRYFGSTASGSSTLMGYDSNKLGVLDFINNTTSLIRSNTSIEFGGGNSDLVTMTLDPTTQRLGIGTLTPQDALDITGNINLTNDGSNRYIRSVRSTVGQGSSISISAGNGVSSFVAGNGGNLNLTGGAGDSGASFGGDVVINGGGGQTPGDVLLSTTTGYVGVKNVTPSYILHVGSSSVGDLTVARFENSGGTCDVIPATIGGVTCTSDQRLKKNIVTLDNTILDKVLSLRIVNYNLNSESNSAPAHTGVIAQELEQVFPDLVSTDSTTGYKSVAYAGLTPYTIKAIQEMNIKITGLSSLDTTNSNSLGSLIKQFLGDVGNSLDVVFFGEVHTKKLCLEDVCVTKDQLQQLLNNTNVNGSGGSSNPPPTVTDICPNVDGVQATVPDGMHIDNENNCIANLPEQTGDAQPPADLPAQAGTPPSVDNSTSQTDGVIQ